MKRRLFGGILFAAPAFAFLLAVSPPLTAQAPKATPPKPNPASKPTPHLADGTPDLNGTYFHEGGVSFIRPRTLPDGSVCFFGCPPGKGGPPPKGEVQGPPIPPPPPSFPKYKREFLAKVKDLSDRQVQTDTMLRCQPPGVPRIGPPSKIVHTAREVVFLYDDINGSFFRIVPIDGRPHRAGLPRSFLGDAIGRWEGDTLIVETVNFNDDTWLLDNGAFHTKDLRVIERLRRVGDTVQYQAISYDPAVLAEPWSMVPQLMTITDQELEESARCEDRDVEHIVDGSHHDNAR
jgi:hypothetical protein